MAVNESLKLISKRPNLLIGVNGSVQGNDSYVHSIIVTTKSNDLNASNKRLLASP